MVLLGPRQFGKTTLALEAAESPPAIHLDLDSATDRAKLTEPKLDLAQHTYMRVILDENQCTPQLFQSLRGLINTELQRWLNVFIRQITHILNWARRAKDEMVRVKRDSATCARQLLN